MHLKCSKEDTLFTLLNRVMRSGKVTRNSILSIRSLNRGMVMICIELQRSARTIYTNSITPPPTSAQNASGFDRHCKSSSEAVFKKTDSFPISSGVGAFASKFLSRISVQNRSSTASILALASAKEICFNFARIAMSIWKKNDQHYA